MGNHQSIKDDQQELLQDTDEEPLFEKLEVVIMGHHGAGKNTVGNAILKKNAFKFHHRFKNDYVKKKNTTFGRRVVVTRVPGWSEDLCPKRNCEQIKNSMCSVVNGPHVIILVVHKNTTLVQTIGKLKQLLSVDVPEHILTISVSAKNIVVHHSETKQSIIKRCKFHCVRGICREQNKQLIETIEDFIVQKYDMRFYTVGKKKPDPKLQLQDLVNVVDGLKRKIEALSANVFSDFVIKSKESKIRELERLLKQKEEMLEAKDKEIKLLKSKQDHAAQDCVLHSNSEHFRTVENERKIYELEKELAEKNEEIEKLRKENETLKSREHKKPLYSPSVESTSVFTANEKIQSGDIHRGVKFVEKHRKDLIERVVAVKPIADDMLEFILKYKYEMIINAPNECEQRRKLYDIIDNGGMRLKIEFFYCLQKHEKYLVEELEESQ